MTILGRSIVAGILAIVLLVPSLAGASWHQHAPKFSGDMRDASILKNPRPVPNYAFKGPDGEVMTLADLKGKVVFLNLWATWCPPCIEEMPSLNALQGKLGGDKFEVLALSLDNSRALVRKFYDAFKLDKLAIYMGDQKAMQAFASGSLPTTLFISPDSNIVGALLGPADWSSDEAEAFARYFVENGQE
ncbi:MAG: TlpA disulfide reductase family protein [Rhodospirillaceae bacterium]|nr:TlpA disulfide reductase family protein [Rhodospirillaceae bacterium]MDD9918493.1 TlpA disulfide reductase family protein [Rhodospirillaceae bacterium]MDD9929365.1 TlpA disulfide reductase family protein [Rhodospirillaceae bacterium]